jgi:hypothetical protein
MRKQSAYLEMAPRAGFEPATNRLTVARKAISWDFRQLQRISRTPGLACLNRPFPASLALFLIGPIVGPVVAPNAEAYHPQD